MKTLIIIPAYNEDQNIFKLINDINNIKNYNINILIVDDSVNDKTKKLILKHKIGNVNYENRGRKLGRGSAVRYGFEYAIQNNFDYIFEMDADYSHTPNEIIPLINKLQNSKCDLVIASRYLTKSEIHGWPLQRRIFSKLANYLARVLFGFSIKDYTNGFRLYKYEAVKELINYKIKNSGFIYLTESLIILKKNNFKISEYPSIFINRNFGKSSVSIKEIYLSLIGIIKLRFNKI